MKTLFLIRHAKSSRKERVVDFDRPLSGRGIADASHMGLRLKKTPVQFDAFYSSSARRGLDTAKLLAQSAGFAPENIISDEAFYTFDETSLLRAVESIDESFSTVAVFCHNFAITDLANSLTGKTIGNVPTCGVVHIETDAELWANISTAKSEMVDFDFPKNR